MKHEENNVNNEEVKEDMTEEMPESEETREEQQEENAEQTEGEAKDHTEPSPEVSEEDEALNTKYMRLMADFQNFKRRAEKEKSDIYAYANEKIVTELLTVIDNFERALQVESADKSFAEGMAMIFKQMTDVLEKSGLEEIKAEGEAFDPNFHNAVMTEDNPDFESGQVTGVLQKGYTLNKKVIRPSMVKVNN